ncbi:MAG: hypothetical protein RI575_18240 [Balneolaceae bacterium]|nr:hypothetical protein [Balneolaceae bacterium]
MEEVPNELSEMRAIERRAVEPFKKTEVIKKVKGAALEKAEAIINEITKLEDRLPSPAWLPNLLLLPSIQQMR